MAVIRTLHPSLLFDIASLYNSGLLNDTGIQLEIGPKTFVKTYIPPLKKYKRNYTPKIRNGKIRLLSRRQV